MYTSINLKHTLALYIAYCTYIQTYYILLSSLCTFRRFTLFQSWILIREIHWFYETRRKSQKTQIPSIGDEIRLFLSQNSDIWSVQFRFNLSGPRSYLRDLSFLLLKEM